MIDYGLETTFKLSSWKQQTYVISEITVSVGEECGLDPSDAAAKLSLSIGRLTWGRRAFVMAHSQGYWLEASASHW